MIDKLLSQQAFIKTSYVMIGVRIIGMALNVTLHLVQIITEADFILATLVLSWLALTFAAYGNIISAQVTERSRS